MFSSNFQFHPLRYYFKHEIESAEFKLKAKSP